MLIDKSILALGLCAGAGLFAQEALPPPQVLPDMIDRVKLLAEPTADNKVVRFFSAEFGVPGKTVKGVPYQAQALTETTQTLADGNRIVHKSTALLARDSEGRTRREQKIDSVGQWSTGDQPAPLVFINDPVAQTSYVLESNTKTARKSTLLDQKKALDAKQAAEKKALTAAPAGGANVEFGPRTITTNVEFGTGTITTNVAGAPKLDPGELIKESLGSKTIEGTPAEGTRVTRTVAAGKIGNERPLTFVNETWYSSELGMTVMSRSSDPQSGETVYTLTNIQRSEPDPALFTVPAGYTVQDGPKILFDKHEN
jgi:hypothetical protein